MGKCEQKLRELIIANPDLPVIFMVICKELGFCNRWEDR